MPRNLYFRSFVIMIFLWSIVFALAMAFTYLFSIYFGDVIPPSLIITLPIIIALIIVGFQFLLSPWIMDITIDWLYDATKHDVASLPPHIQDFLNQQMQEHNFSLKWVAIIHDNNPNAFTYGHTKKRARIVITEGILNYLNEDEQLAVVAHEVGHIIHRDFIWMTVAAAVPLICYSFYQGLITFARTTSKDDDAAKVGVMAAILAVIAWIVFYLSHFLVLFLSRIREYYADRHSAQATTYPGALSRALVKIAYGMVRSEAEKSKIASKDSGYSVADRRKAARQNAFSYGARSMGIFDVKSARGLANSAYGQGATDLDEETVAHAASWDLSNPWGGFLELFSTHPLPAKRILALNEFQVKICNEPAEFPGIGKVKPPESLWDEFFSDLFLMYVAPLLCIVFPLIGVGTSIYFGYDPLIGIGIGCILFGIVWKWRRKEKYPKLRDTDPTTTVVHCLTDMTKNSYYEASPLRGKPAVFEGVVVGRGSPGYWLSEDLVVQDDTGIITLDYSPLLFFMAWIFAWLRVPRLIGTKVKVLGWYHRSPSPMLQVWKIITPEGKVFKNRWAGANRVFMWFFIILGIILIAVGSGIITIL